MRERDQPGRDPGAARVRRVHVRVRVAGRDVDGVADPLRLGRLDEQLEDLRVDRRAAVDDRAAAELGLAVDLRVAVGDVGRAGHVDRERDLRARARRRSCARPPKSPTSSCTAATAATSPGAPPASATRLRRLERDVGAEPVVERARGEPPARELDRLGREHRDVADLQAAERLVAVARADVDVQVLELELLRLLAGLERLPPLRPITPGTGPPLRGTTSTRWPWRTSGRCPPTVRKKTKPLSSTCVTITPISSMWPRTTSSGPSPVPGDPRDRRAQRVARHGREAGGGLAPDVCDGSLVARRARRGQQFAQELGNGHARSLCGRLPFPQPGSAQDTDERSKTCPRGYGS